MSYSLHHNLATLGADNVSNWKDQLAKEWVYLCAIIVLFTLTVWSVFFAIREPGGVERYFGPNRRKGGGVSLAFDTSSLLAGSIRSLVVVVPQDAEEERVGLYASV